MRAGQIVQAFRGMRALVIGDAMLDTYLEGSATRLCAEGPVPVVHRTAEEHVPGGAANTAANLRALGAEVDLVAVVGQDAAGAQLRSALERQGVVTGMVVNDPGMATLHKLRILADGQYVVRFDSGGNQQLSSASHSRLSTHLERAFKRCDVVIISDYRYGAVTDAVIDQIRRLRDRRKLPLVVDSKDLPRFAKVHATVVTPNHREARRVVDGGAAVDRPAELEEMEDVARALLQLIDTEWAAITMADKGVLLMSRTEDEALHIPAHPVMEANDVGAGDSFTAATALALAAGASVEMAARVGVDASGIAVARHRTTVVQHQELLQRVSLRDVPAAPSLESLVSTLRAERILGKTVVFTNGVFDILHAGHVHFLRAARTLGDCLVVGVNSDRSAQRLKGPNRPINGEHDRLALVSALDAVDHAVLFDEDTPADLIRTLCPDVHVKGGDYAGEALPETEAVHEVGGRVEILPLMGEMSTSDMIDRIVALAVTGQAGRPL